MTEPTIPDYANLLRRAAANHAADATRYADREQKLTTELTRFEEWMQGEHARIQAELNAAQAKADEQLREIAEDWEARKRDLAEAGRAKTEHQKHATGAERAWRNWCHDEGISPDDLPPLRDTGPMPAIAAPEPKPLPPVEPTPTWHSAVPAPEGPPFNCQWCGLSVLREHGTWLHAGSGEERCESNQSTADPKLPSLEVSDAVLEAGRRAANPNTDPGATRVDAGGDQPAEGPFPGGVESPAEPRPKRNRRRPQSDRVNEQDGDSQ